MLNPKVLHKVTLVKLNNLKFVTITPNWDWKLDLGNLCNRCVYWWMPNLLFIQYFTSFSCVLSVDGKIQKWKKWTMMVIMETIRIQLWKTRIGGSVISFSWNTNINLKSILFVTDWDICHEHIRPRSAHLTKFQDTTTFSNWLLMLSTFTDPQKCVINKSKSVSLTLHVKCSY